MAEDDNGGFGDPSNPFPTTPDPFTAPPSKRKKDIKKAVVSAGGPDVNQYGQGFSGDDGPPAALPTDESDIGGKDYRFTAVTSNPEGNVQDYAAQAALPYGPTPGNQQAELSKQLEQALGGVQNSQDISPHEYDALTKEASKGNKLAQQILVKGRFAGKDYPSLNQDLTKLTDPFVQALSGMPALAENAQSQMQAQTAPYDFTNAEAQVNNLLGQMGSSMTSAASPETQSYVNSLNQSVAAAGNLSSSALGLPSIMSALEGLGPAAKESQAASPYASLLAALLSHQQYEDIYEGAFPQSSQNPAWLQSLLASVTGTTSGGGIVSPVVAAGGVGSTPSTGAEPTGSNA
jgi:hypothetical protein